MKPRRACGSSWMEDVFPGVENDPQMGEGQGCTRRQCPPQ